MHAIGDIHIYVSDLDRAVRFWAEGLGLRVAAQESTPHSGFAVLEFSDNGPALRLLGPVHPWSAGEPAEHGTRPTVSFDITSSDFEGALLRLLERGGAQLGEIESYNELRLVTLADPDGNTFDLIELPRLDDAEDAG